MPRRRKVGLSSAQDRYLGYVHNLITRDPLWYEFLRFPHFDKLYRSYFDPEGQDAQRQYWEHQDRLRRKWGVDVKPLPPWPHEAPEGSLDESIAYLKDKNPRTWTSEELELYCDRMFSKGVRPQRLQTSGSWWPLQWTVNSGCVGRELMNELHPLDRGARGFWTGTTSSCLSLVQGVPVEGWDGYHGRPCFGAHRVSLDQAHTVTLEVDLASITIRNLDDIAAEIKKVLRTTLPFAQNAPKRKSPKDLDFLRTITPKAFDRALKAYDLHMREGLTLAETAKRLKRSQTRVEADVKRVYRAIHRKDHTARRRRIDNPAKGIEPYHCPKHAPKGCPEGCKHMNDWLTKVNRVLPTDTTGTHRGTR